ncbi:MAG: GAF domain-containing protein [Magnetococcales bacterium]|nr:GAF domain-containing protein [Magnetococcales bacterium]
MSGELLDQIDCLRREISQQNTVNEFLKLSLNAATVQGLLEGALTLFLSLSFLGSEKSGAAFLVNEPQPELIMVAHHNMTEAAASWCARLPVGHCLCGRAAVTGKIHFASSMDDRHEIRREGMEPHGHYHVPILVDGKVAGLFMLCLQQQEIQESQNPDSIKLLETVATIVAGGLKRLTVEEKIRFGEAMERMVIENTPCGIVVVGQDGIIRTFNSMAERLFGP